MGFIRFLQGIRTTALDFVFSYVTRLGEEVALLAVIFLFLWCINKKYGYFLCALGITVLTSNLFLKMIFRVPRPWVLDPSFPIVESAREGALGYSFPSGHTQIAVGMYGGIARLCKNRAVRTICIAALILVAFSRMYLGVHTLYDVLAGASISVALIFAIHPIFENSFGSLKKMNIIFAGLSLFCITYLVFLCLYPFPAGVETAELSESIENGYKILGIIAAIWISYIVDVKHTKFETGCVWWGQVIKLVLGFAITFAIKELLKNPLALLFGGHYIADTFRYFLIAFFAGCIWPMTFKLYPKTKEQIK